MSKIFWKHVHNKFAQAKFTQNMSYGENSSSSYIGLISIIVVVGNDMISHMAQLMDLDFWLRYWKPQIDHVQT